MREFTDRHERLVMSLDKESGRGCVLVCGASIDRKLEEMLRAKFKSSSEISDDECSWLLSIRPLPPLGSPGVKAMLLFAIGVISRGLLGAIGTLFDIRNKAAHEQEFELTIDKARIVFEKLPPEAKEPDATETFLWLINRDEMNKLKNEVPEPPHQPPSAEEVENLEEWRRKTAFMICALGIELALGDAETRFLNDANPKAQVEPSLTLTEMRQAETPGPEKATG